LRGTSGKDGLSLTQFNCFAEIHYNTSQFTLLSSYGGENCPAFCLAGTLHMKPAAKSSKSFEKQKVGFSSLTIQKQNVKGVGVIGHTGFAPCFHTVPMITGGSYSPVLQYLCMKQRSCAGKTGGNYKPNFLPANLCVVGPQRVVHEGLLHCRVIWAVNEASFHRTMRQAVVHSSMLPCSYLADQKRHPLHTPSSHLPSFTRARSFHSAFLFHWKKKPLCYAANSPLSIEKPLLRPVMFR
jgi:hypothetical protein